MGDKLQGVFRVTISCLLVLQLTGCGTLLYPERRGQVAGHLDAGIVVLDAAGLLFGIIPGVIAFAVDFSNGCIYLPARAAVLSMNDLKQIKFDPKNTSLAQIEKIIKDQTGYTVKLAEGGNVRLSQLKSKSDMVEHFAQLAPRLQDDQLALNR